MEEYETLQYLKDEILDTFIRDQLEITFVGIREDGTKVYMYPEFKVQLEEDEPLTEEDEIELGIDSL